MTLGWFGLVPLFLYLLAYENRRNSFIAAAIYAVCALTDWMDGWLARISNKVTTLGKFLDPLADKVIVISALAMLVKPGRVPEGSEGVISTRKFLVSGVRTTAAAEGLQVTPS